jgi:predicted CopG family antitoxin
MTELQHVQGAMYDKKTKFLLGRESYSDQLKTYFKEKKQMSDRVCMVMFSTSKKKAEKKYLKLRKKYVGDKKRPSTYEVRYVTIQDFEFEPVGLDE